MFYKSIFICIALSCVVAQAQSPGIALTPEQTLEYSSIMVAAEVEEKVSIVNYEKTRAAMRPIQQGENRALIPLFSGPDIGYLFRVKILETIKPNNSKKDPKFAPGAIIEIFSRFNCASHVPCLFEGKKYLFFLSPFDSNDHNFKDLSFDDAAIYRDSATLERKIPFDPKGTFMFGKTWEPARELTAENTKRLLDQARQAAKKE